MRKHLSYLKLGVTGKHGDSFMGIGRIILVSVFLLTPLGIWYLWILYKQGIDQLHAWILSTHNVMISIMIMISLGIGFYICHVTEQ